jgi:hypothetical protein
MAQDKHKVRRFSRELEVALNEHELQQYGSMIAKEIKREDKLTEKKKKITEKFSGAIKNCRREQRRLAEAREMGVELRPVECEEKWIAGTMQIIRLDTGAVVDVRPATSEDNQLDIDDALNSDNSDDDLDDEDLEELDVDLEGDEPTVITPPGEAPDAKHRGEDVVSSVGERVHHMPDDEEDQVTQAETPAAKGSTSSTRAKKSDAKLRAIDGGASGKPNGRRKK